MGPGKLKKAIFSCILWRIAGSSNGRIHPSEGCHLGSSPSPATVFKISKTVFDILNYSWFKSCKV